MKVAEVRNWLGIYFLVVTSCVGAYILLFGGSSLLPLSEADVTSSFEIIIPVFVGQLTIVFQWFGNPNPPPPGKQVPLPPWAVKGPPLIVVGILVAATLLMAIGNHQSASWTLSSHSFKALLTFCVTLLNATTVFVTSRYFKAS